MFGTLGMQEILLLMGLALLIFGPKRLPEIGRTMGRAMGEFRRATTDLKRTLEYEADQEERRTTASKKALPASEAQLATSKSTASSTSPSASVSGDADDPKSESSDRSPGGATAGTEESAPDEPAAGAPSSNGEPRVAANAD